MQAIPLRVSEVADRVTNLRKGLFRGGADGAPATPFELGASHDLYVALFGPIENLLAKKRKLLVVPTASLTSLPFQVLVTRKPDAAVAQADRYKKAAWLINDKAIAVLPSVASLRALPVYAKASHANKPFIGFCDPLLQRPGTDKTKLVSRNVQPYQSYYKGTMVDLDALRTGLPALPETGDDFHPVPPQLGPSSAHLPLPPPA